MNEAQQIDADTFEDPLSNYEPVEYKSELQRVLAEDPVTEIQLESDFIVEADTSIGEAIRLMHAKQVSCLLVVDGRALVGVFSERDVLERVAERFDQLSAAPVRLVMTSDPTVVYESDPVGAAVAAIAIAGHRHVPVLKLDGTPTGIVSPRCLLRFLEQYFDPA